MGKEEIPGEQGAIHLKNIEKEVKAAEPKQAEVSLQE